MLFLSITFECKQASYIYNAYVILPPPLSLQASLQLSLTHSHNTQHIITGALSYIPHSLYYRQIFSSGYVNTHIVSLHFTQLSYHRNCVYMCVYVLALSYLSVSDLIQFKVSRFLCTLQCVCMCVCRVDNT